MAAVPKSAIELEYVKAELAKAKEIQDAYNKALKGAGGVGKEAQALDSLQVSLIGSTEKYSEFDKVVEKVTNKVFLLSPNEVTVTAEDRERIAGGFYNQS